ncbi:hypothetical protein A0H81_14531 [Grifola frondosa]|uniref:Uncharacterized protein n=1 Tax=Grifola frondosa TaxID=5627 RepID=A0A1C7LL36_GRIFR|nr:hypothetical protein A0H81_14531 [Grifola frondosa]
MTARRLQNATELLENILSYVLAIPHDKFCTFRTPLTFVTSQHSSASDVLLVSKLWFRTGNRLLYESAIIRTSAQAQALKAAVSQTRSLGLLMRRLRVEAGHLDVFFLLATGLLPKIKILYISVDVGRGRDTWTSTVPPRLQINPAHILIDSLVDEQLAVQLVEEVLAPSIQKWTALTRVDLSDSYVLDVEENESLVMALCQAPSLERLFVGQRSARFEGDVLAEIAKNPKIRGIYCRGSVDWTTWKDAPEDLRRVLHFGLGVNSVSLQNIKFCDGNSIVYLPDLPDQILTKIFGFATHVHCPDISFFNQDLFTTSQFEKVQTVRRNIIASCKRFYRLGIMFLYSVPLITDYIGARLFGTHINSHPHHARFVRVLYLPEFPMCGNACRISVPLPSLVYVSRGALVLPALLSATSSESPSSVLSLSQLLSYRSDFEAFDIGLAPPSFAHLVHLRHLALKGGHVEPGVHAVPRDALPSLEHLDISQCGATLIPLFTEMRLPSLTHAAVSMKYGEETGHFLHAHGTALALLSVSDYSLLWPNQARILDMCPNIVELCLKRSGPLRPVTLTSRGKKYTKLERILLPDEDLPKNDDRGAVSRWKDFLWALDFKALVALVEFRLQIIWPCSEFAFILCGRIAELTICRMCMQVGGTAVFSV